MTSESFLKVTVSELCEAESIDETLIVQVVEYGIAEPVQGENSRDWIFDTGSVHWLKKAVRLYHELEIDWVAVAMVIELLKQKEALLKENQHLQEQLQRFL
jgi:chaperone modulatory protein CbpM